MAESSAESAGRAEDAWILVVEDDQEMREKIIIPGLRSHGFANVLGAASAIETYRSMLTRSFSIFLLDVCLPDESGLSVARHIRASTDAGVVMLTGRRRSRAHRVQGLDEGADAYLTKPLDLELLVATIRSLLRRLRPSPTTAAARMPAVGWQLDSTGWNLTSPAGIRIRLTRFERVIVGLLFAQKGEVVPRDAIVAKLVASEAGAQDVHDFDPHRLDLLVHRLRRKVATQAAEPLPLSTMRNSGYVFTPE